MAYAELKDAKGIKVGIASMIETADGVEVVVHIKDLPPGVHGIHFHEKGKCTPSDFSSAGSHFNPSEKSHGFKNPNGPHAGDLPNLNARQDGSAIYKALAPFVTLKSGPNSLLKEGGTALVIHSGPDDMRSDPAGNSGTRIVCGEVEALE
jgi:Cu-Zn family superoxide dismutase